MYKNLLEKDYVTISTNIESKTVMVSWNGTCLQTEYRDAMETALIYAQELNLTGWISDTKNGKAVDPENIAWVSNYFIPKALYQIKKVALVVSDDLFRNFAAQELEEKLTQSIKRVAYFNTQQEAQNWISE